MGNLRAKALNALAAVDRGEIVYCTGVGLQNKKARNGVHIQTVRALRLWGMVTCEKVKGKIVPVVLTDEGRRVLGDG